MRRIIAIAALLLLAGCVAAGGYSSRVDINGVLWTFLGSPQQGHPGQPQGERRW